MEIGWRTRETPKKKGWKWGDIVKKGREGGEKDESAKISSWKEDYISTYKGYVGFIFSWCGITAYHCIAIFPFNLN